MRQNTAKLAVFEAKLAVFETNLDTFKTFETIKTFTKTPIYF